MRSYLTMMAVRLLKLRRVLKPTGSLSAEYSEGLIEKGERSGEHVRQVVANGVLLL